MLTTIIYITGALSLHFTDIHSQNAFFFILLPLINILFFIFLLWQLIFYFALSSFSNDDSSFFELLSQLWHLGYTIERNGLVPALLNIVFLIINAISLFVAVIYYFDVFWALVHI